MHKVSAVIITKNEELSLEQCITSLSWCDEIILVDDYSDDKTVDIAKKHNARVFKRKLDNDFAGQRNFGIKKTIYDWVLFVDADEVVTDSLKKSILSALKTPEFKAYGVSRVNILFGKKLNMRESSDTKLVRLVNKSYGQWKRKVHEYWFTNEVVGDLNGVLLHYSSNSISDLIYKIANYSEIHSSEVRTENKKASMLKVIFFPLLKFINNYIFRQGYKDGERGFILSTAMSFHSFLSWSKLCLENQ